MSGTTITTSDRLTYTLFLAAVAHGILILGVTFAAPTPPEMDSPTLEVVMLSESDAPDDEAPDDPDYLAQRDQVGEGNTEEQVRPELEQAAGSPVQVTGHAGSLSLELVSLAPPSQAGVISSRTPSSHTAPAERNVENPAETGAAAMPLEATDAARVAATETTPAAATSDAPREQFIAVNTREARFAAYLVAWKEKVERLGTINFPAVAELEAPASPVLEVAIRSDGTLHEIIIRRSSGNRALDQAAVAILRQASPFDVFPPSLREQMDVLRFAYEWRFTDAGATDSSVYAAEHSG